MSELIGSALVLCGAVFLFSAGVGLLRMPDVFARVQTGTKATTLGNTLILVGLAIHNPEWIFTLILLIYFIFVSNPISSHALVRAARSAVTRGAGEHTREPGRSAVPEEPGATQQ